MAARTLSHYTLIEKIGEGGMGEVYKAQDTRLERLVALKLLPAGRMDDPDRRRRFVQEARAASALNHPNIVTIYDIGEAGGVTFIAMEYVAGKTLAQVIPVRGMRAAEALRIAVQMADALARAHSAGIIHRDLKPGNVMVSDEGVVKLLDFGLAKLAEPAVSEDGLTRTIEGNTAEGTVLGTAGYMSPEQAEGKAVDARSDIFSFGAVLYEMLTGRRAFRGDSQMSTLAAILREEPKPARELVDALPPELDRVLTRCLRKDPARRFQTMADLAVALREMKEETDSGTPAARPGPAGARPRRRWLIASAALMVALTGGAVWWRMQGPAPLPPPVRVTRDGLTFGADISRDGKLLAYAYRAPDKQDFDIWIRQLPNGEPHRVTSGAADEILPNFSPDGTRIAYQSSPGGIYVVPALGGEPRRLSADGDAPRFSPDGSEILYEVSRHSSGLEQVMIVPASGGAPVRFLPEYEAGSFPTWSPDGKEILFAGAKDRGQLQLMVAPRAGGEPRSISGLGRDHPISVWCWAGSPDRSAAEWLYLSYPEGGTTVVARVPVKRSGEPKGAPETVTRATDMVVVVSAAADGQIAYSTAQFATNLWELPLDADAMRVTGPVRQITAGEDVIWHSISRDGMRAVYLKGQQKRSIYARDMATGADRSLVAGKVGTPSLSNDGAEVAYFSYGEGGRSLWVIPFQGGEARKVMDGQCTPNGWDVAGHRVVCQPSDNSRLFLVDTVSGRDTELLRHSQGNTASGFISNDGRWLTFSHRLSEGHVQLIAAPVSNGVAEAADRWVTLTNGAYDDDKPRLSPNGQVVYFRSDRDGFVCVWGLRLDRATKRPVGEPVAVQHFHGSQRSLSGMVSRTLPPIHMSLGPQRLLLNLDEVHSDVWLAKVQ